MVRPGGYSVFDLVLEECAPYSVEVFVLLCTCPEGLLVYVVMVRMDAVIVV